MIFGSFRLHNRSRWLPVYMSPVFWDRGHPYRSAVGVAIGSFGRAVYGLSKKRLYG